MSFWGTFIYHHSQLKEARDEEGSGSKESADGDPLKGLLEEVESGAKKRTLDIDGFFPWLESSTTRITWQRMGR